MLGLLLVPGLALCAQEPRLLRYDLRPGDHLVYRQTLEREVAGRQVEASSRGSWTSHALVLDANGGTLVIGFQRNRTSGELLRLKVNGQDRLRQGRKDLAERLARSTAFAEANRFDPAGWAQMPPQVVRETNSKALFDIREIMPLPPEAVRIGDRWDVGGLVPMSLTAAAWEPLESQTCLRINGASTATDFSLRYWFCPESGLLQRLEIAVAYPAMSGGTTREKLSLELMERRRGDDGMTLAFFSRFQRDPFPRSLNFQARTLRAPRLYWLEMLEKDDGLAEVKAEIEQGNTIRLSTRRVRRLRLLLRPELFPVPGPVRVLLNGKEVFSGELPESCSTLEHSLQQTADPELAWSAELMFEVPK